MVLESIGDVWQSKFGPVFERSTVPNVTRASTYVEYRSAPTNTSGQQSKKGELPKCCPQVSIVSLKHLVQETSEGLTAISNLRIPCWV